MADTMQEKMLKMMGIDLDGMQAMYDTAIGKMEAVESFMAAVDKRLAAIEDHLMQLAGTKGKLPAFIPADLAETLLPGDDTTIAHSDGVIQSEELLDSSSVGGDHDESVM